MPNIEQLEAEKSELEQRYKRMEQELTQFQLAYTMVVVGALGFIVGFLTCWLAEE